MPSKVEYYRQMARMVTRQLTENWKEWANFLTTASRIYKYSFHEQIMIYAPKELFDLLADDYRTYVEIGQTGVVGR